MDSPSSLKGAGVAKSALAHRKPLLELERRAARSPLRRVSVPFPACEAERATSGPESAVTSLIRQYYVKDKVLWYEKLFGANVESLEEERQKNSTLKQLLKHKEDRIEMLEQENAKLTKVHSTAANLSKQIEEMEVETKYQEKVVEEMQEVRETRERKIQYLEEKASSTRSKHRRSMEKKDRSEQEQLEQKLREIERQLSLERADREEYVKCMEREQQKLEQQQGRTALLEQRLEEMATLLAAVIEEKKDLQERLQEADTAKALPREPSIQVDMSTADGDIDGILGMVALALQEEGLDTRDVAYASEDDVFFSDVDSMSECDLDSVVDDDDLDKFEVRDEEEQQRTGLPRIGSRLATAHLMGEIANQSTAALATLESTIIDTIQTKNTQILTTKMELNALRSRLHTALEAQAKNEEQVASLQAELQVCEKHVDSLESQVEEHKEQERLLMRKETERLRNEIASLQKETAERTYDIINLRKGIRRSISTLSKDVHEQVALEYLDSLVDVHSFVDVCLAEKQASSRGVNMAAPVEVQPAAEPVRKRKKKHRSAKETASRSDENSGTQAKVRSKAVAGKRPSRTENITHSTVSPAPTMLAKTKHKHSRTDNLLRHLGIRK